MHPPFYSPFQINLPFHNVNMMQIIYLIRIDIQKIQKTPTIHAHTHTHTKPVLKWAKSPGWRGLVD